MQCYVYAIKASPKNTIALNNLAELFSLQNNY